MSEPPPITTAVDNSVLFHPVARWKFILLSLTTLGLYEIYWSYKCWKFIKANGRPEVSPIWRAIFAPIWLFSLNKELDPDGDQTRMIVLATAYFFLSGITQLPDPYWLFSLLTFVPLLPVVQSVNLLNAAQEVREQSSYSTFRLKHLVVSVIGVGLVSLILLPAFNVIPTTFIVPGSRVPESHKEFMTELGVYTPDEEILLFYSEGIFSFKEGGQFFTDKRVVSYWEDFYDGGYEGEFAYYADIADIAVDDSDLLGDTYVTVTRKDGVEFTFFLSPEMDLDEDFVRQLKQRWTDSTRMLPE
ncbi:MAG TPA: hypothetical protein DCX06_06235 [Opitutae bacterium]|nr:hypothetical protein [Opitutae bacterium]